jgi:2-oxoglutarate dehydrogenase E2 component (dihydrolipoamide succinyltransferase)
MLIDVVMPQMGESLAEGTVVRWIKKPGDRVERDESLFEISTDKVDTDVPAPASGTLQTILVPEGQTVSVGARVAVIDDGAAVKATAPATVAAAAEESGGGHFKNVHAAQLVSFRRDDAEKPSAASTTRSFSPAVLDAARKGGVPLQALTSMSGSGRGGRITKADVARFVQSGGAGAAAPVPRTPSQSPEIPAAYLYQPTAEDRVTPMSPVRKKIADHMTWSVRISPHASAFAECDLTATLEQLKRERDAFKARTGSPLTITVLAAAALARTLREFPSFNASVVGDSLVTKPRVHLGLAVALPDTDDLIVPVIRDADGLSIAGMARAVDDLASRARERRLKVEDVQGGTVTLTNPGMFGGVTGTPILNQPQVAILGLGAIAKRAVVLEDDRIAPRSMMTLALTFDHRAADGMAAFKFLGRLKERLEAGPDEL